MISRALLFLHADSEKHERTRFFVKRSRNENFQRKIFRDGEQRNCHGLSFQNIYMKGGYKIFWPCFGRLKSVEGDKMLSIIHPKYEVLQKSVSSTIFEIELALLNHFFP